MTAQILNRVLLLIGAIGLPICIAYARKTPSIPFLLGIGLFGYLLASSIFVEVRNAIKR